MYDSETIIEVDLRCPTPSSPNELLGRLEAPSHDDLFQGAKVDVLINLKCGWCSREAKKRSGGFTRVVHKFNMAGKYIDTYTE